MSKCLLGVAIVLWAYCAGVDGNGGVESITCYSQYSPCFHIKQRYCPKECPSQYPTNPKAKACYLNCNNPICKPECKSN